MDAKLIEVIHAEFGKHSWDTFVSNPPAIAHGGNGVVVPGCPACKVRISTMNEFMEHVEGKIIEACRRSGLKY